MNEYVVTDRTTATKYAITISNGILGFSSTSNATSDEPVFEDRHVGGNIRLFINDGQLGLETTLIIRDDNITFFDSILSSYFKLYVYDGQLAFDDVTQADVGLDIILNSSIEKYMYQLSNID